jgi:Tfp pilus assembly protein PilX
MIITLMVLAVVMALASTVTSVTVNNLQSSWRAQQAGAALNAADAGVAQAVTHLRNTSLRDLECSPTCGAANPWGDRTNPANATVPGDAGEVYRVWICRSDGVNCLPGAPASYKAVRRYTIHSTGTAEGSAVRSVEADALASPSDLPLGIFARTINGGGNPSVMRQSIFSTGCVYGRKKITMSGIDVAYGIPAAVHSSQIITEDNGTGQFCPATDSKRIHKTPPASGACHADYPADQDRLGGSLLGIACASTQITYPSTYQSADLDGNGSTDVNGSYIRDDAALTKLFGIKRPALTQAALDQLRSVAKAQGNFWTSSTGWSSPDERQAVMFFDLTLTNPGGTVDLKDVVGFSRNANVSATDPACDTRSLLIVIEGGNVKLNGNQRLAAAVFLTSGAPHGQVNKASGNSDFIGTLYADTIDMTGTADLSMDTCFLANINPSLLKVTVTSYRELDR